MSGSPGGALFETLAEIARQHDSFGMTELTVVPVLYRSTNNGAPNVSFAAAIGVISAAAHFQGGVLVNTAAPEYDAPLDTSRDPVLEGSVPVALAGMLGPATELRIEFDGASVDAKLRRRGDDVTATGGEARFLAVVRALFAPELRTTEFAVLAYREGELDSRLRPACFRMVCGLQEQPGLLAALRTLVIAVETPQERPAVHCPPGVGARYLLKQQRVIRRHPPSRLRSEVARLALEPDRPVVLFLAAGFSASSGLPVGNGLRDEAIARILGEDPAADLDWARELFRRQNALLTPTERRDINDFAATLTFEQVMRIEQDHAGTSVPRGLRDFREIHDDVIGKPPGAAVRQLQRLLDRPNKLLLLTVNFDELLEESHRDKLDVVVEDDEFSEFAASGLGEYLRSAPAPRKVPYLKLHGTISDLATCVASSRQTQQGLSIPKRSALEALLTIDEPLRWVYVGASMRDVDLRPVFDDATFRRDVDERWVAPFPDDNVEDFAAGREQLEAWKAIGLFDRQITETADTFMTELAEQWLR
jgi:hypothetical protein